MPKTYTNDIAAAFPTSLEGPLTIAAPGDPNSWITVDPATAKIAAVGIAQPIRTLVIPYAKIYSSATSAQMGQMIACHFVTTATSGGFYAAPVPIPADMDVTKSCKVKLLVSTFADSTLSGAIVRYVLGYTVARPGASLTDGSITYDYTAPTNWVTTDPRVVTIDDGSGVTFAANVFQAGDHLGLRISRIGSAAEDTFDKSVNLANVLMLEYTANQY